MVINRVGGVSVSGQAQKLLHDSDLDHEEHLSSFDQTKVQDPPECQSA